MDYENLSVSFTWFSKITAFIWFNRVLKRWGLTNRLIFWLAQGWKSHFLFFCFVINFVVNILRRLCVVLFQRIRICYWVWLVLAQDSRDWVPLRCIHPSRWLNSWHVNWAVLILMWVWYLFESNSCNCSLWPLAKLTDLRLALIWVMHVYFNLIKRLAQRWFHAMFGQQSCDPFFSNFDSRCWRRLNWRLCLWEVSHLIGAESWWQDIWVFGVFKIGQV